jgi:arylsulfatase A-like enzyme
MHMNATMARRWFGTLAVGFIIVLAGCNDDEGTAPKPKAKKSPDGKPPNVLLISVDTLRPDHLGCYGYERDTSPNIDRLAAEGSLFETMVSSTSWTLPAHCSMFTGLSDTVHGCVEMNLRLADDRVTIAEMLKDAGYQTVGLFSGPAIHPVFGVAQGFDEYIDCTSFADVTIEKISSGQSLDGGEIQKASTTDITNPRVLERTTKFLNERRKDPFFLFVHWWDVHFDYIPPSPYDTQFDPDYEGSITGENVFGNPAVNPMMDKRDLEHIIALYDGEIAWTDMHIGKLMATLDELGLRDNTIVIFTADHGEEFFEHGRKGHRMTLFDEVIRLPLIIRYPGVAPAGERFTQQARMIDLVPTILDLAGLPPATNVMGQSLAPVFRGEELANDTLAISELFSVGRELRTFRRPSRKLLVNEKDGGTAAFNLAQDPGEHSRIAVETDPILRLLIKDAQNGNKWLEAFRKVWPVQAMDSTEMPDHVRKQLESLGYIGGDSEKKP